MTTGVGASGSLAAPYNQKPNTSFMRGKPNKQSGPQNFVGTGRASQGNNNWGSRVSEKSVWLSLINKLSKLSLLPVCNNVSLLAIWFHFC